MQEHQSCCKPVKKGCTVQTYMQGRMRSTALSLICQNSSVALRKSCAYVGGCDRLMNYRTLYTMTVSLYDIVALEMFIIHPSLHHSLFL